MKVAFYFLIKKFIILKYILRFFVIEKKRKDKKKDLQNVCFKVLCIVTTLLLI